MFGGAFSAVPIGYVSDMVLRPRTRRKLQSRTSVSAYNAALHFLARPKQYRLTDEGFAGQHDHAARPARDRVDARALSAVGADAVVVIAPGRRASPSSRRWRRLGYIRWY